MSGEKFKLYAASYLILKNDNQLLLSLRQNTMFMDGYYSLVAGHFDGNEPASRACLREAEEEANIKLTPKDIKAVHIMNRKSPSREYMDVYFLAENYKEEIKNMEPEKCGGLEWFEIDKLPNNTAPYIKFVLENYSKGIFYSEWEW
ncbi:MAG: NUDIX domain-containing protein [Rickettsiales bacterium]|jgi:ADP-ribose pyrophosphatase YjhB (NUDIX family)|nr:NUDIX domain-containing protein [Rickettsiales bacterium]